MKSIEFLSVGRLRSPLEAPPCLFSIDCPDCQSPRVSPLQRKTNLELCTTEPGIQRLYACPFEVSYISCDDC